MALLAALGLIMVSIGLVYAEINCETLAVRAGDPAYIICHFDVDVIVAKKNIKVQRRPLTSTSFDPDKTETVLDCYWENAADFSCQFGNGFTLVGEAGRTAVVRIASASKNDEQIYRCEVVPLDPSNIQTCTLTMRDTQPLHENCSLLTVATEQLQEDTAKVKDIVTATIICVIVGLVLDVLLTVFRKQLKENLYKCLHRAPSHNASLVKKDTADPEAALMLSEAIEHAGDEGKSTEDLKEKEKIERYIRHLKIMKEAGSLDEFYKVNHTADLIIGSASILDSERTAQEHKVPNNPDGLHISVEEWYSREMAEVDRKTEEIKAEKELYTVRETQREKKKERKRKDEERGITDPTEDPNRRKRREEKAIKRREKENAAAVKLDTIRKRHDHDRKLQAEQDKRRVTLGLQKLRVDLGKRSQSDEDRGNMWLCPVPESAGD